MAWPSRPPSTAPATPASPAAPPRLLPPPAAIPASASAAGSAPAPSAAPTLSLRNVARYVRDVAANVPLYEALGFRLVRTGGDLAVLHHHDGPQLVLHRWDERPKTLLDTPIAFTRAGRRAARERAQRGSLR